MNWTPELIASARAILAARGLVAADASDETVIRAGDEFIAERCRAAGLETERAGDMVPTVRPLEFAPSTINEEARSVDVVLATESPVRMVDPATMSEVDEILVMAGFDASQMRRGRVPILDTHQRKSYENVLGSHTAIRVKDTELHSTAIFSSTADRAFTLVREGHLDGVSAGYRIFATTYVRPGESAEVAGRTYTAGDRVLALRTSWTLAEGSVCPVGKDPNSGTRAATPSPVAANANPNPNTTPPQEDPTTMNLQAIIDKLVGRGYTQERAEHWARIIVEKPEAERAALVDDFPDLNAPSATRAEPAPAPTPIQAIPAATGTDGARAAIEAERARINDVRDVETRLRREFPELDLDAQFARAYSGELDANALCAEAVRLRSERQTPAVVIRDQHESIREGIEAGIAIRAGLPGQRTERELEIGGDFANYSFERMARECLERSGVSTRRMDNMEVIGRALTHGTGDFPNALANTARRSLVLNYEEAVTTWQFYCDTMNMRDFRTHSMVGFSEAGELDEVPPLGEIPQGDMSDKAENITLKSYGKRFGISRQALINDDLGVFSRIPAKHGAAWARTINRLAVKTLLANAALSDGNNLYSSAHANLDTTTAAITTKDTATAVIRSLRYMLQKQTGLATADDSSEVVYLNLQLKRLLVCPTIQEYVFEAIGETGRADNNRAIDVARLMLEAVPEPELENTNLSGAATNLLFGFCDPRRHATLVAGFLNGNSAPRMEVQRAWSCEGTEFKVCGDVGIGVADHRGSAKHVK